MRQEKIKMDTTNMPDKIKEARKILAEINDLLDEIGQWVNNIAYGIITELNGKWQNLCSKTKTARSKKFIDESTKLLKECDFFRVDIVKKSESFAEHTRDKVSLIAELAGDSKEIKSALEENIKLWNDVVQPQLDLFYEKTAELESSIMNMMEFAVQPIEAAAKPCK